MIAPLNFPPGPNAGDQYTAPDGRVFEWSGSAWLLVPAAPGGSLWTQGTGTAIYRNGGNVGVGTGANPQFLFDVNGSSNAKNLYLNGVLFATFT